MNLNTQPPHRPVGQYPRLTVTVFVKGNDKTYNIGCINVALGLSGSFYSYL